MNYLITVSYDGTRYHGYQVQNDKPTVQKALQDAVESLFGKRFPITGCSRTDSGVHARDFKATVITDETVSQIPPEGLPHALNTLLPEDISVRDAVLVSDDFHPRYDVRLKEYEYLILQSKTRNPFYENRAYLYPKKLDVPAMNEAAKHFVGRHDFSAFMASGSDITDCQRTVFGCSVTENNGLVSVKISGDGFLYNMVRIIAGTLISVSEGKIKPSEITDIIDSKDRQRAGFTAPAHGLYLNRVEY